MAAYVEKCQTMIIFCSFGHFIIIFTYFSFDNNKYKHRAVVAELVSVLLFNHACLARLKVKGLNLSTSVCKVHVSRGLVQGNATLYFHGWCMV